MKIDIKHVAKLANISLTPQEQSIYGKQLSEILDYVELIESVDTKNVEPTFNVIPENNITQKDTVNKNLTRDEAIKNSAVKKDGYIVTKGVFIDE